MVTILDCPLREKDWVQKVELRNGTVHDLRTDAGDWASAVNDIRALRQLDDDWDGFGAKAPDIEIVESAIGLAHLLNEKRVSPPVRITSGVDGTIVFEWQGNDGFYADVEIVRPLFAEAMLIEPGQKPRHWTLPTE